MQITEQQITIWNNCGDDSTATQQIRNKALQYYIQYKQHLKQTHQFISDNNKISNLMLISYFISQKSELIHDMSGNRMSNISFSINQLAKKHNDYKQFFYHLKQMMKKVTLPQQASQSLDQINAFMKYFSFLMTFYNKFLSTFQKIEIHHKISSKDLQTFGGQKQYKDKIKYLLWVVYITFRRSHFKNNMDTIGNTCLLACLFGYFIKQIYKQQKILSIYAPDIVQDYGTFSNQYSQIEQNWLDFFKLSDIKTYQQVRNTFTQFIQKLTSKVPQLTHPFSPKTIFTNIKKLQQIYHRNMEINQIDQTLFLKNLISNQQNIRFTAFGGRRKVNKYHNNNLIQCKRALTYDQQVRSSQVNNVVKDSRNQNVQNNDGNYMQVFHKIKASQTPVMLIQATPVNQFATAYNWLYNKSLAYADNQNFLNLQYLLQIGYKDDQFQLGNTYILQKRKLIEGLFIQILEQFGSHDQQTINIASILALQVFYYVMNITNRQISELVNDLNVSWFSVWKGIDKLLNYDKNMPNNVKTHLLLLQTSIVASSIWKQQSFVQSLKHTQLSINYKQFYYRVLHHIAYQINFIGKNINLSDTLMDQAFIVSQFYLKQYPEQMQDMNLDVIIMCAIYGVCKAKNIQIKFKNIMSAYKTVNNMDDKAFQTIQILYQGEKQNFTIIHYYNQAFLKNCKSILLKIKGQTLENDQKINSPSYVLSPVKSILPQGLMSRGGNFGTPSYSQMLYAYNQSPLLKKNKRLLTDSKINKQNMEGIYNNKKYYNQSEVLRQRSNNVSQMLQKKFGNNKNSTLAPKAHHANTFKQS